MAVAARRRATIPASIAASSSPERARWRACCSASWSCSPHGSCRPRRRRRRSSPTCSSPPSAGVCSTSCPSAVSMATPAAEHREGGTLGHPAVTEVRIVEACTLIAVVVGAIALGNYEAAFIVGFVAIMTSTPLARTPVLGSGGPPAMTGGQMLISGRTREALDGADAALARNPDDTDALFHRATALRLMTRYEEAEAAYSELLERKPDLSMARTGRAMVRSAMGKHDEARADTDALEDRTDGGDRRRGRPGDRAVREPALRGGRCRDRGGPRTRRPRSDRREGSCPGCRPCSARRSADPSSASSRSTWRSPTDRTTSSCTRSAHSSSSAWADPRTPRRARDGRSARRRGTRSSSRRWASRSASPGSPTPRCRGSWPPRSIGRSCLAPEPSSPPVSRSWAASTRPAPRWSHVRQTARRDPFALYADACLLGATGEPVRGRRTARRGGPDPARARSTGHGRSGPGLDARGPGRGLQPAGPTDPARANP